MTSIADPIAGPSLSETKVVPPRSPPRTMRPITMPRRRSRCRRSASANCGSICFAARAVADLHRSSAAEHPDLVHDPQLRIFRRHRNLHLHLRLHRGLCLRPRDAAGGLRGRDRADPAAGLADLRRACVPVHDLPGGDFLRRHQFREPALHRRNGHHGFPEAARRHHRPGAAAAIPSRQHGRAAALHRADAVSARSSSG